MIAGLPPIHEVRVNVQLQWENPIGLLLDGLGYNAIEFYRILKMPIIPPPLDLFTKGPEWLYDLTGERWSVFENENGTVDVYLDCKGVRMGTGTKECVQETIKEMLAAGWMKTK